MEYAEIYHHRKRAPKIRKGVYGNRPEPEISDFQTVEHHEETQTNFSFPRKFPVVKPRLTLRVHQIDFSLYVGVWRLRLSVPKKDLKNFSSMEAPTLKSQLKGLDVFFMLDSSPQMSLDGIHYYH